MLGLAYSPSAAHGAAPVRRPVYGPARPARRGAEPRRYRRCADRDGPERQVAAQRPARRRRHGRGVRGDPPPGLARRGQGPPHRVRAQCRAARSLPARGQDREPGRSPRARRRGRGRPQRPRGAVPRHGAAHGHHPPAAGEQPGRHPPRRAGAARVRRRARPAREVPLDRHRPPRHQAGEHLRHERRPREGPRFRHRPDARPRAAGDARGAHVRHAGVHVARAGDGRVRHRRPVGSLVGRREPVHPALGQAAQPRPERVRVLFPRGDADRAVDRDRGRRPAGRDRGVRRQGARLRAREPVPERRRDARRAPPAERRERRRPADPLAREEGAARARPRQRRHRRGAGAAVDGRRRADLPAARRRLEAARAGAQQYPPVRVEPPACEQGHPLRVRRDHAHAVAEPARRPLGDHPERVHLGRPAGSIASPTSSSPTASGGSRSRPASPRPSSATSPPSCSATRASASARTTTR
jgi:hypothetical protein